MIDESKPLPPPGGQFLVYQTEDGKLKIDVRFEGETVWLTQPRMAELFRTTQQNISLHLQHIYAEGELEREATHKESLLVQPEGARPVQRRVDFFNLDAILSVGYRVKSAGRSFLLLPRCARYATVAVIGLRPQGRNRRLLPLPK
jgi:hypothetical protein